MSSEEKRYALLIDSDNVSAKYIDTIFDELADRGMVTVRRIYGQGVSTDGIAQLCFEIRLFQFNNLHIRREKMLQIRQ